MSSIARQRREAAAALAILMEQKNNQLLEAAAMRDDQACQDAAVQLALLGQQNTKFLIFVLKTYAGTAMKLPGGAKPSAIGVIEHHDSLVEAVQADNEADKSTMQ